MLILYRMSRTLGIPVFETLLPVLITCAFEVVPAVAWWTLCRRARSARWWSIAASLEHAAGGAILLYLQSRFFSVGILGIAVGIVGLAVFVRSDSAAEGPARPVPPRMPGDGTSKITDHLAQGAAIGLAWLCFFGWSQWGHTHQLAMPGVLSDLIQLQIAIVVSTLAHELGHAAAGWVSGMKLRLFQVGPALWAIRNGRWKFSWNLAGFYGGVTGMASPHVTGIRSRHAFMTLGGPVASLVMASVTALGALTAKGNPWEPLWPILSMLASISFIGFAINLIPQRPDRAYSDGARLFQLMNGGGWAHVEMAFSMVSSGLVAPTRPRDWDMSLLDRAGEFLRHGDRGMLLRLFACQHLLEAGREAEAISALSAAENLFDVSAFRNPADILSELVFLNAVLRRDLNTARRWWLLLESPPAGTPLKVDKDADYWKAAASIHWLEGRMDAAREAWIRGQALALRLPNCGAYEHTRWCFHYLQTSWQTPAEVSETLPRLPILAPSPEHQPATI